MAVGLAVDVRRHGSSSDRVRPHSASDAARSGGREVASEGRARERKAAAEARTRARRARARTAAAFCQFTWDVVHAPGQERRDAHARELAERQRGQLRAVFGVQATEVLEKEFDKEKAREAKLRAHRMKVQEHFTEATRQRMERQWQGESRGSKFRPQSAPSNRSEWAAPEESNGLEEGDARLIAQWRFNPKAIEMHVPLASYVGETGHVYPTFHPTKPRPAHGENWKEEEWGAKGSGTELATAMKTGDEGPLEYLREARVRDELLAEALEPHGGVPRKEDVPKGSSRSAEVRGSMLHMLAAPEYDGPYTERPERVYGRRPYIELPARKEIWKCATKVVAKLEEAAGEVASPDEESEESHELGNDNHPSEAGREEFSITSKHMHPRAMLSEAISHGVRPSRPAEKKRRKFKQDVLGGAHRPYGLKTDAERSHLKASGRYTAMCNASMQIALRVPPRGGRARPPWAPPTRTMTPKHLEQSHSGKNVVNKLAKLHAVKSLDMRAIHENLVMSREALLAHKVATNPNLAIDRVGQNVVRPTTGEWTAEGRREAIQRRAELRDARRQETRERAEQERVKQKMRALDLKDRWETKIANHSVRGSETYVLEPELDYKGKLYGARSMEEANASVSNERAVMRRISQEGNTPPPEPTLFGAATTATAIAKFHGSSP